MSDRSVRRHTYRPRGIFAAPPQAVGLEYAIVVGESGEGEPSTHTIHGDYAVVDINGPLSQHGDLFCQSYDYIRECVTGALASEAPAVLLNICSPGGDFAGAIELARELRAMCANAGKRLCAFTDSCALSAAYALACAAEDIYITPTALVGSIGVWAALCDETARDTAEGYRVVIVASGNQKAERNPHVSVTDEAISHMQAQVGEMAQIFFAWVAETRRLSPDAIKALQGAEFLGVSAIRARLADRSVNSLTDIIQPNGRSMATHSYEEAMAIMRGVAEGEDEDAEKARAALDKFEKHDEPDGDEKAKSEGEGEGKAEGEGDDEKKAAARADGNVEEPEKMAPPSKGKKAKAEDDEKKAPMGAAARALALAERVHALETERRIEKEQAERERLFASRPDFSPQVRATLASMPLAAVRDAVNNWPRSSVDPSSRAAASTPNATRGAGPSSGATPEETAFIDRHMSGGRMQSQGIKSKGHALELGFMTNEDAAKYVKRYEGDNK